jgi:PAS domain S-box-containing protein
LPYDKQDNPLLHSCVPLCRYYGNGRDDRRLLGHIAENLTKKIVSVIVVTKSGGESMLVRDFMTPNPAALTQTDTIKDAARLFFKYRVNGAPVVDENNCVLGLVTNAHLVEAMMNDIPVSTSVTKIMTKNVITITPDATIEEAWQIPVSRLPVVSKENKLTGIMTRRDFLTAFYTGMCRAKDEVESLVGSSHNGIVAINGYGVITTWNAATEKLTGIEDKEAIGRHILDVIPNTGLLRVLSTGEKETGCSIKVNGQTLVSNRSPICEGPKVVGALAIFQDTSELVHVCRQLTDTRQEIDLLNNVFEHTPHGMIIVDKNTVILKVNTAYEEIMGISCEELIGRTTMETLENTRMHIVMQTGVPEFGDIQMQRGRQVIVNRVPLFNKDGEIIGAIGEAVFKDVKEVYALLERMKELNIFGNKLGHVKKEIPSARHPFDMIIGRSRPMVQVKNLAAKAAAADSNVMISGESGTGKDLFAQAIHNASPRRERPFVAVNCAAIPSELLESELFGYEEGAFTGAKKGGKKGKFEIADKGTVFLDEIGDMPLAMQAKLLRVIEERKVERVGGTQPQPIDVRIIAATNKPLLRMAEQGRFREDLYYRLNVISLRIPPLRERHEDIGELLVHILRSICEKTGQPAKQFASETLLLLHNYPWPGNVRELTNLIEQLVATVGSPIIMPKHLPPMQWKRSAAPVPEDRLSETDQWYANDENECERITQILKQAKGNKALAAKLLGIHRSTLYEKIKKYNIT